MRNPHRIVLSLALGLSLGTGCSGGASLDEAAAVLLDPLVEDELADSDFAPTEQEARDKEAFVDALFNAALPELGGFNDDLDDALEGQAITITFSDGNVVAQSNLCRLLGRSAMGDSMIHGMARGTLGIPSPWASYADPGLAWPQSGATCFDPLAPETELVALSGAVASIHEALDAFAADLQPMLEAQVDAACDDLVLCPGVDIWIFQLGTLSVDIAALQLVPDWDSEELGFDVTLTGGSLDFQTVLDFGPLFGATDALPFTVTLGSAAWSTAVEFGRKATMLSGGTEYTASVGWVNRSLTLAGVSSPDVVTVDIAGIEVLELDLAEMLADAAPDIDAAVAGAVRPGLRLWPRDVWAPVGMASCTSCDVDGYPRCGEVHLKNGQCFVEPFLSLQYGHTSIGELGYICTIDGGEEHPCGDADAACQADPGCLSTVRPLAVVGVDFDEDYWHVQDTCVTEYSLANADEDGDGWGDLCDMCLGDPDNDAAADGDGVCSSFDNCPDDPNPFQADADHDGMGDVCDPCPLTWNADDFDLDFDGLPAECDDDDDGDGYLDFEDNCPGAYNPGQEDSDFDGVGNACEDCHLNSWSGSRCGLPPERMPRYLMVPFDPNTWDRDRRGRYADPRLAAELFDVRPWYGCADRTCKTDPIGVIDLTAGRRTTVAIDVERHGEMRLGAAISEHLPAWMTVRSVEWTRTGGTVWIEMSPTSRDTLTQSGALMISDGLVTWELPLHTREARWRR